VKVSRMESMLKSAIWRVIGIIVLGVITYVFTGSWMQTTIITFAHHGAFLLIYYLHERLWIWIKQTRHLCYISRHSKVFRPILYEIILGHLVLGLITLAVTGSWLAVSLITPTYILNKLWMYVVFDKLWESKIISRLLGPRTKR